MAKLSVLAALAGAFSGKLSTLSPADTRGGWFNVFSQPPGNFQHDIKINCNDVLESSPLFACATLIAGDIAKLRPRLVELQEWGGWKEVSSAAFSPVLRKPNRYQNHIQFKECWLLSKLTRGNTYVLKERDSRGVVVALYVLDPARVCALVADDGSVFYQLNIDNLSGVTEDVIVPASEIIHDRFNCLFHPLVGLSPIFAAGLPALQHLRIGRHGAKFFENNAQPGGVLSAPGAISDEAANRIKTTWQTNYTGINAGRVAVLGDGLQYTALSATAVDSQVIEQLKWGAETVAAVYHVPAYKLNVGALPTVTSGDQLDNEYYKQCLQVLIEAFEACMDEGLGVHTPVGGRQLGVDLDLSGLMRMDTPSKVKAAADSIGAGFMSPNEARAQFDLAPVKGGEKPVLQQQNWPLDTLAQRPPPTATPAAPKPEPKAPSSEADAEAQVRELLETLQKGLANV
jgi:HK97 family phage portal protein